jgi:flagellin-specific chaperone FliS
MKKVLGIALMLLFAIQCPVSSKELSDMDFMSAKIKLIDIQRILTQGGFQIDLIPKQEFANMTQEEQINTVLLKGNLETGAFIAKEIFSLYALQSMYSSMPPEAKKMLIDSCLGDIEFLNGIIEKLKLMEAKISNPKVKNILNESLLTLNDANEAIKGIKDYTESNL